MSIISFDLKLIKISVEIDLYWQKMVEVEVKVKVEDKDKVRFLPSAGLKVRKSHVGRSKSLKT